MPFRNVESHFSRLPDVKVGRSSMPLNHTNKFTMNAGKLVPFYVQDVLPGDTFSYDLSLLIRMSTSIVPVMDNLYLDTYFFFVPNRLLWINWQHFMGESDTPWANTNTYVPPYVTMTNNYNSGLCEPGSIYDYLGIVPGGNYTGLASGLSLQSSALPFNAYIKIWNDYFRDENLQSVLPIADVDGSISASILTAYYSISGVTDILKDGSCLPVAKYHDYFTSALPAPQKGPDVLVPNSGKVLLTDSNGSVGYGTLEQQNYYPGGNGIYSNNSGIITGPLNLTGLEITVNNLRLAIQTQKFLEKAARYGTRYIEILKGQFGVDSPDARLQRAEYLSGSRVPINMSEVVQTSETNSTPLGTLAGRSVTSHNGSGFTKSFVEHGWVIGVCCIRHDRTYSQGIEKQFLRTDKLHYYWPVFAHLGEQPIIAKELYCQSGNSNDINRVFGYQEAWAEYRYKPNRACGWMNPAVTGSLANWTYGDVYTGGPYLSSGWIKQGTNEVDRTLVVPSSTMHQFLCDFYVHGKMVRSMPVYSIPGLMDHF